MITTAPLYPSEQLRHAVQLLEGGGILAYPTETLYGLGVDPFNPQAVRRLLDLKGREAKKGLILLVPNSVALLPLVQPLEAVAQRLIEHFWPAPLTLVLPAQAGLSSLLTGGTGLVAVRHSSSPYVQALMAHWQRPLVSTSANPSGSQVQHWSPERIAAEWGGQVDMILAGPYDDGALASTVVKVIAGRGVVLREGAITCAQLQQIIPIEAV
ncbi:translation factor SUA5 [Magnetococcus marinus MC-1]|uniref:L-threonylcarbamoyladenylate synthase n=1 Tax=Magnetococcus marinus (strain ATCC BAA-1437 / JCM 17883 / MC-1) TaxID=156889 RepID=A0LDA5_MAGMM|nr:L-threonylcarbamoyladenylate synthase [Magnetococcus marinus]ABK45948.1 translation factor SUA5 [Magnetococcus marinus MC-1]